MRTNVQEEENKTTVTVTKKEKTPTTAVIEKTAGRPLKGKSKATNKIAFYVDDETLEWLSLGIDRKKKIATENAVAKEKLMVLFEMENKR